MTLPISPRNLIEITNKRSSKVHRPAKIPAVNIFEDLNGVISKEQQLKRFNRETHMCEWLVELLIRKFPTFCFCFMLKIFLAYRRSLFEFHKHTHMCLLLLTCMISTSKPLKILCFFIIKAFNFNLCSFRILSIFPFPWYREGMLCICLRKETKTKTNQSKGIEALWTVIWGSNCC